MDRLNRYHDPYQHQDLVFPGAGHIVGGAFPYRPTPVSQGTPIGTLNLGGTVYVNSLSETQAWHEVLNFLARLT